MNILENEIKKILFKHRDSGTTLTSDVAISTLTKDIVEIVKDLSCDDGIGFYSDVNINV